jgi:Ca-activated chloride channel family protein
MSPRELAARRLIDEGKKDEFETRAPGETPERKPFIVLDPKGIKDADPRQGDPPQAQPPAQPPEKPPEKLPAAPDPEGEARLSPSAVFKVVPVNPFVMAAQDRLSTFALDVDTASYSIARRYIRGGYLPPVGAVRMEEFVNAFDYNYPRRTEGVFSVISEAAPAPFGPDLVLLKVGVRGKVIGRELRKPANLVFVVDASGSMDQPDRMPLVKYALGELVGQLGAADRVTLVAYGTKARLMLEGAAASDRKAVLEAIDRVQCEGSTNLSEGLALGYRQAAQAFVPGGVNRVILCSDGAANIGITAGESILDQVRAFRDKGITCTCVGFGAGTYNDVLLEKLADSGDGSYVFVDSKAEARRVFVEELSATLQTIAKDAKIQVEFDPRRVRRYRLIGYENRDVADEKFRDDTVDAGEVGSGQSATALYELELQGAAEADLGTVHVRYRDVDSGRVEEVAHRLEAVAVRARTPESDPRFYLAACAAEFAELLRGSEHAAGGSFDALRAVIEQVAAQPALRGDLRVQELVELVRRAKGLPRAE